MGPNLSNVVLILPMSARGFDRQMGLALFRSHPHQLFPARSGKISLSSSVIAKPGWLHFAMRALIHSKYIHNVTIWRFCFICTQMLFSTFTIAFKTLWYFVHRCLNSRIGSKSCSCVDVRWFLKMASVFGAKAWTKKSILRETRKATLFLFFFFTVQFGPRHWQRPHCKQQGVRMWPWPCRVTNCHQPLCLWGQKFPFPKVKSLHIYSPASRCKR